MIDNILNLEVALSIREKINATIDYINSLDSADALLIIGSYSSIAGQIDTLSTNYTELSNSLDILSGSYSIIEDNVDLLIGSYSGLEMEIDILSGSYSGLDMEIDILSGSYSGLDMEINILSGSYSGLEDSIGLLSGSVSSIIDSGLITNSVDSFTSTPKVNFIISLSQAEYDAIVTKDVNTLYIII